jgi:hypothetical protein
LNDANAIGRGDFLYPSKQVCQELGIASSTLRTWCLRLEQAGHIFYRERKRGDNADDIGVRMFYERDITTLRKMKRMLDDGYSLDKATQQTLIEYSKIYKAVTIPVIENDCHKEIAASITSEERHPAISEEIISQLKLLEYIPDLIKSIEEQKRQNESLLEMVKQLNEEQQELLNNSADQRQRDEAERARIEERDRLLMNTLRELQLQRPWWKRILR